MNRGFFSNLASAAAGVVSLLFTGSNNNDTNDDDEIMDLDVNLIVQAALDERQHHEQQQHYSDDDADDHDALEEEEEEKEHSISSDDDESSMEESESTTSHESGDDDASDAEDEWDAIVTSVLRGQEAHLDATSDEEAVVDGNGGEDYEGEEESDDDDDGYISDFAAKASDEPTKIDESISKFLSPELREIAQITAKCLHDLGTRKLSRNLVHQKIMSLGSARLKKFWKIKSEEGSVQQGGYSSLASGTTGKRFREYRGLLLEAMVSENKTQSHHDNTDEDDDNTYEDEVAEDNDPAVFDEEEAAIQFDSVKQNKLTRSQLSPELQELAEMVAKCLYQFPDQKSKVPQRILQSKILADGSARLKTYWEIKCQQGDVMKRGYSILVKGHCYLTFQKYRDELLTELIANNIAANKGDSGDEMDLDVNLTVQAGLEDAESKKERNEHTGAVDAAEEGELGHHAQENESTAKNESGEDGLGENEIHENAPTGRQLSPELQDLARIVATCLYQKPHPRGSVPKEVVQSKILAEGSVSLKKYWKIKSKTRVVIERGYPSLVTGAYYPAFRKYRQELLAEMIAKGNSDAYDIAESEDERNEGERIGEGELGHHAQENELTAKTESGEDRLVKYEMNRVVTSVPRGKEVLDANDDDTCGNVGDDYEGEEKSANDEDVSCSEEDTARDDRAKTDESSSEPLPPEIREIAQIVAKCLHERTGRLPKEVVHNKIKNLGSPRLKKFWKLKSKQPSVRKRGYATLVTGKTSRPFKAYRDQLLAEMVSESKAKSHDNTDEDEVAEDKDHDAFEEHERTARNESGLGGWSENEIYQNEPSGRLELEPQEATQIAVLGKPFGKDELPSLLPPELQELARLVAECMAESSKQICHHDTLAHKVASSQCAMLKKLWDSMEKMSRFQRDGYPMLISRSSRKKFQNLRDQLLSFENIRVSVVTPAPQNKSDKFAEVTTITITAPSISKTPLAVVTTEYQEEADLGRDTQSNENIEGIQFEKHLEEQLLSRENTVVSTSSVEPKPKLILHSKKPRPVVTPAPKNNSGNNSGKFAEVTTITITAPSVSNTPLAVVTTKYQEEADLGRDTQSDEYIEGIQFEKHLEEQLLSRENDGVSTSATKTSPKLILYLKKSPPVVTPQPQKKSNHLAELSTISTTSPSVSSVSKIPPTVLTTTYKKETDLCLETGDGINGIYPPVVQEYDVTARKCHKPALSDEHLVGEERIGAKTNPTVLLVLKNPPQLVSTHPEKKLDQLVEVGAITTTVRSVSNTPPAVGIKPCQEEEELSHETLSDGDIDDVMFEKHREEQLLSKEIDDALTPVAKTGPKPSLPLEKWTIATAARSFSNAPPAAMAKTYQDNGVQESQCNKNSNGDYLCVAQECGTSPRKRDIMALSADERRYIEEHIPKRLKTASETVSLTTINRSI